MEQIDTVVIGAGIVGLAVARALAQTGREVWVLERELQIGTGVSARNSEVLHAGLYYPPGSAKARLCVRGKELWYALCASHGVPHSRCGKLVVATDESQLSGLKALAERGRLNGVPLDWLDGDQARALEPELHCLAALWSPSTGIIDSHGAMLALQGDLERAGGVVALGSKVVGLAHAGAAGLCLQVQVQPAASSRSEPLQAMELQARQVVNAAGLQACALAQTSPSRSGWQAPHGRYAKGSYYSLAGVAPFQRLIYPAPQDAWLGVHLTLDLGGQAKFGPDLQWLPPGTSETDIDYRVEPERAASFYAEVRRYWPALPDGGLQPAYSGVRPKIHGPDQPAPDFRIDGPAQHGTAGLVHLLGIESPGLTSALAIAEQVRDMLA